MAIKMHGIYWKKAAIHGNPVGEGILGALYIYGQGGVPQNTSKALYWLHKSAAQGNPQAKAFLDKIKTR